MGNGRGGICAAVLSPGRVRVGDCITVTTPPPRDVGRQIAGRLRREADGNSSDGPRHGSPGD
jgi:MOSC domain-containing protein YiiM